jgi:hypothetical protein
MKKEDIIKEIESRLKKNTSYLPHSYYPSNIESLINKQIIKAMEALLENLSKE